MEVPITVPDDIAHELRSQRQDLPRHGLEALVANAYRDGALTAGQVRRLLGLPHWRTVSDTSLGPGVLNPAGPAGGTLPKVAG